MYMTAGVPGGYFLLAGGSFTTTGHTGSTLPCGMPSRGLMCKGEGCLSRMSTHSVLSG